jgi:hypothetical protein
MTEQALPAFFPDRPLKMPLTVGDVGRWIDQDGAQLRVIIGLAMQEEKAGLGRDRQAHFVRQLETTATFELLLGQKDPDMSEKFGLILGREFSKDW